MNSNRDGIALITTLWIIIIITLFAAVYVVVSNTDIFRSLMVSNEKRTMINAESGKNYLFSLIPGQMNSGKDTVMLSSARDTFILSPAPRNIVPYRTSGAFGTSYWIYPDTTIGIFNSNKRYSTQISLGAAFIMPVGSAIRMMGNTMY